jgi:CDP-glycerol glycerophosphotransferase (TagB/SpsB family)
MAFLWLFSWMKLKNCIVFGLRDIKNQDLFLHNSKYFYLYLNSIGQKCVWLTDNEQMIKAFQDRGFLAFKRYSLKGIYYALTSKYFITDFSKINHCISSFLPPKAYRINLWHGIPLKKIQYDVPDNLYYNQNKFEKFVRNLFDPPFHYYISTGEYETECFQTAFDISKDKILELGNQRLDALYQDIPNCDMFMETDFYKIKELKNLGKNLILYMPTFRKTGEDVSGWILSEQLQNCLKSLNAVLVCKLHYLDKNLVKISNNETIYKMNGSSDIYPVLKYFDVLITDYSSIYFDFLLLDKPIIYKPNDIVEYEKSCGFYKPYNDITAGIKVYNEPELIDAIQNSLNGLDNFKEHRNLLCDKMFKYQDGKNCERLFNWIKNLE